MLVFNIPLDYLFQDEHRVISILKLQIASIICKNKKITYPVNSSQTTIPKLQTSAGKE